MGILDDLDMEGSSLDNENDANLDSSTEKIIEETGAEPEKTEEEFDKSKTAERFNVLTQHNRELKDELEELRAWREEIETERSQRNENEEQSQIPAWFSDVMGENEAAWKGFQGMTQKMKEETMQAMEQKIEATTNAEKQSLIDADNWVDSQLELVRETYGELNKSDMNKLMSIVEEYEVLDSEGNIDLIKGYKIMQALNEKPSTQHRKSLVDTSYSSRTVDTEPQGRTFVY